jgi:hypothetical protein
MSPVVSVLDGFETPTSAEAFLLVSATLVASTW